MSKRTIPSDPTIAHWAADPTRHPTARHTISSLTPDTDLQALMEAAPGNEPLESREATTLARDVVAACVDMLPEEERFVIEALFVERVSQRDLARRMGFTYKSAVERIRDRGLDRLRELLERDPIIQQRINQETDMNDANMIDGPATDPSPYTKKAETWDDAVALALEQIEDAALQLARRAIDYKDPEMALGNIDGCLDNAMLLHNQHNMEASRDNMIRLAGAMAYLHLMLRPLPENEFEPTLYDDALALLIDRHHKYGPGNINRAKQIGLIIRMGDKTARIANNAGDFEDETMTDAWMDLIGYATIGIMLRDGTFDLPLADEKAA